MINLRDPKNLISRSSNHPIQSAKDVCSYQNYLVGIHGESLKETTAASETFATYTEYHPFIIPLLNFIFFLLQAIEANQRKLVVFKTLCELYKPSIERDPSYEKYLQMIGMIFPHLCLIGMMFFGKSQSQRPQHEGIPGIFGDLLNQGLDDDLDDESASGSHPHNQSRTTAG
ncbi:Golgi to ER traffic protein 4 homolog [Wyeomyia smithii]|uniref:Golgi to ER traffic protein 4 homolog n=1 Tax=Wyeomyia smithii TaxID=174621 RepID=UPI002467D4F6|nr:Golgi to ER traffic protein 4 homolog [Wyeomyia smithii]